MVWFQWILTATLVVAADQASKAVVLARWPVATSTAPRAFISIHCILNRRGVLAALGGAPALTSLWAALIVVATLALHYGLLGHQAFGPSGVGAVIGGATGNVLDRLRRGAVVDFLAIGPWPVFNLADTALVVGTGLIVWNAIGSNA